MANNLQKVHGSTQAVFAVDTRNGSVASLNPTGDEVNFVGPAMDFFNIQTGVSLAGEMGPTGAVGVVLASIAQTATVMIYQVESGTGGNLSIAVYPKGAYQATTASPANGSANLVAQLNALGSVGAGPVTISSVTVTDLGFKLAQA